VNQFARAIGNLQKKMTRGEPLDSNEWARLLEVDIGSSDYEHGQID